MDEIKRGALTLRQIIGDALSRPIPALIGNPTTGAVYANASLTQVFVHGTGEVPGGVTTAQLALSREEVRYGRPVLLRRTKNGYTVISVDAAPDAVYMADFVQDDSPRPVYVDNIIWGTLHIAPSGGMRALVAGAFYGAERVKDQLTADFSTSPLDTSSNAIDIPTTPNRAIGVLVQVNAATGTLSYKQGAEFDAALSHAQAWDAGYYPDADSERNRIGWLRLTYGMTAFAPAHLYNAPDWGASLPNSGVTAGSYTNADITVNAQGIITAAANGSSGGGGYEYILLQDQKSAGTDGGTFPVSQGNWFTRELNAEVFDTGGDCTLSSNEFTLTAGTYDAHVEATPCEGQVRMRIYNVSDSAAVAYSITAPYAHPLTLKTRIVIASSKTFRIEMISGFDPTGSTDMGQAYDMGEDEIYLQVELRKVS